MLALCPVILQRNDVFYSYKEVKNMNNTKIGAFLKELRKEKGFTQEQLAEQLNVSRRSVSRWETGYNLPDLDILIEMADYYDVGLQELLSGERENEEMNKELEETISKVAEYSNEDKLKITKRMHMLFIGGFVADIIYTILFFTDHADNFWGGLCLGITSGMIIVGIIITSKYAHKIRKYKMNFLRRR